MSHMAPVPFYIDGLPEVRLSGDWMDDNGYGGLLAARVLGVLNRV